MLTLFLVLHVPWELNRFDVDNRFPNVNLPPRNSLSWSAWSFGPRGFLTLQRTSVSLVYSCLSHSPSPTNKLPHTCPVQPWGLWLVGVLCWARCLHDICEAPRAPGCQVWFEVLCERTFRKDQLHGHQQSLWIPVFWMHLEWNFIGGSYPAFEFIVWNIDRKLSGNTREASPHSWNCFAAESSHRLDPQGENRWVCGMVWNKM